MKFIWICIALLVVFIYHLEDGVEGIGRDWFNFFHGSHDINSLRAPSFDKRSYFINKKGMWIFTKIWKTKQNLDGIVFIVHDFGEHCGVSHYQPLIRELNSEGYSVFMMDLQGHGKSNGERMYFEYFEDLVDDFQQFMILVFQDYPKETPFFILGHGFGGHIALQLGLRIERGFKGIILSSVPLKHLETFGDSWVLEIEAILPKLNFRNVYQMDKLTRNKDSLLQAENDPLYYNGPIKVRPFNEILLNFEDIQENLKWIDWPILSMEGSSDPYLTTQNTHDFFNRIPSKEKSAKIYEGCFHQLFDDPQHNELVLSDLLSWIHQHKDSKWDAHKYEDFLGTCQEPTTDNLP